MTKYLISWRPRSEQGVLLARQLKAQYYYHDEARGIHPAAGSTVINWGCGDGLFPWNTNRIRVINKPEAVSRAVGKIDTFRALKRKKISTPEWTVNPVLALSWIKAGGPVFARRDAEGNNGKGIKIYHLTKHPEHVTLDMLLGIPLFTKGFADYHTFRAFVFKGKVDRLYSVEKDDEYRGTPSPYIHNHRNGWVFYDANKRFLPKRMLNAAGRAVSALKLDFGAVDFGVTRDKKKYAIYEINSAFGGEIEDAQLNARAMKRAFRGLK